MAADHKSRRNSYVKKYDPDVRLDWQERAACLGRAPEFDYDQGKPTKKLVGTKHRLPLSVQEAQRVCVLECSVREACLVFALQTEIPGARAGVYGGLTPNERDALYNEQIEQTA